MRPYARHFKLRRYYFKAKALVKFHGNLARIAPHIIGATPQQVLPGKFNKLIAHSLSPVAISRSHSAKLIAYPFIFAIALGMK